jgi:DNA invertase Pin-like site-specific DNA recombinase
MNIETIINKVGSQSELARLLGVKRGTVWLWKRDGIPKSRLWQLQALHPKLFKEMK